MAPSSFHPVLQPAPTLRGSSRVELHGPREVTPFVAKVDIAAGVASAD